MSQADLEEYFTRIGYRGPCTPGFELLAALQRRHVAAIPFENLDPLLGRPVRIDPDSLERKLVRGGRGGYCFEQNGLFAHVLRTLGYSVTTLAARVCWMLPDDAPRSPLSHMLLTVAADGENYLCDVGFGGQSPTAPLRFVCDIEQQTPHGRYQFSRSDSGYELAMRLPEGWAAMYRFKEEPQTARDYEVFNWYTATHPASRFTGNLVAALAPADYRLTLMNDEWTRQWPDGRREQMRLDNAADVHRVLADEFGIRVERAELEAVWPRLPKLPRADAPGARTSITI